MTRFDYLISGYFNSLLPIIYCRDRGHDHRGRDGGRDNSSCGPSPVHIPGEILRDSLPRRSAQRGDGDTLRGYSHPDDDARCNPSVLLRRRRDSPGVKLRETRLGDSPSYHAPAHTRKVELSTLPGHDRIKS